MTETELLIQETIIYLLDFSFSFRHCEKSYQGIKMVAI